MPIMIPDKIGTGFSRLAAVVGDALSISKICNIDPETEVVLDSVLRNGPVLRFLSTVLQPVKPSIKLTFEEGEEEVRDEDNVLLLFAAQTFVGTNRISIGGGFIGTATKLPSDMFEVLDPTTAIGGWSAIVIPLKLFEDEN